LAQLLGQLDRLLIVRSFLSHHQDQSQSQALYHTKRVSQFQWMLGPATHKTPLSDGMYQRMIYSNKRVIVTPAVYPLALSDQASINSLPNIRSNYAAQPYYIDRSLMSIGPAARQIGSSLRSFDQHFSKSSQAFSTETTACASSSHASCIFLQPSTVHTSKTTIMRQGLHL
jgi:hypothetical protein